MNFFLKIICTALFISLASLIDLCAQELVWSFHLEDEIDNIPYDFWVEKNGEIVINIGRKRPPRDANRALHYQEKFLLKLNKDGEFAGNVYIDACKNRTFFLPFGKKNYLTYGHNCMKTEGHFTYGSRLFDKNGKLLKLGEILPEFKMMQNISPKKLTFFSRKLGPAKPDLLYIGQLNKNLKVSYDSISIIDLKREEYNMVISGDAPGKVDKSSWVVPIHYGTPGKYVKNSQKSRYGGIFYVEKNEMKWHYTTEKYGYFTREIETHKDNVYVLFSNPNRGEKFLMNFDKSGNIKNEAKILVGDRKVVEMKYFNESLLVLSERYLNYYSPTGEQLKRIKLPTVDKMSGMTILKDGSVIVTAVKNKKTFIFKLGKKEKEEETEEEEEKEPQTIQYAQLTDKSKAISSLNVFPNPTVQSLNFVIGHDNTTGKADTYTVEIYAADGKSIMTKLFDSTQFQVDVSDLPSGTYFYRIFINREESISGQFVKI